MTDRLIDRVFFVCTINYVECKSATASLLLQKMLVISCSRLSRNNILNLYFLIFHLILFLFFHYYLDEYSFASFQWWLICYYGTVHERWPHVTTTNICDSCGKSLTYKVFKENNIKHLAKYWESPSNFASLCKA